MNKDKQELCTRIKWDKTGWHMTRTLLTKEWRLQTKQSWKQSHINDGYIYQGAALLCKISNQKEVSGSNRKQESFSWIERQTE